MNARAKIADPVLASHEAAKRQIEMITGSPDTAVSFRLIHDSDKTKDAIKLFGTLDELRPQIKAAQAEGVGVFIVVNEGGDCDTEITTIRAVFVDCDDHPLPSSWHVQPDFIVQRDETHWHAYWRVFDLPVERFRETQKRLAAYYKTDPSVCNPSRVMRLAGTLHQKGAAQ